MKLNPGASKKSQVFFDKKNECRRGLYNWYLDCFKRGYVENPRFWSRLGGAPSFKGLKLLEIGCGVGSLSVYIANRGAKKVVALDIKKDLIQFANEHVAKNFPQLQKRIKFRCCSIRDVDENSFDIIVSKDAFEHILHLDKELIEMKKRLKPRGKVYVGLGPLFHSLYGDHGRTNRMIPWGHLLVPESVLIAMNPNFGLNRLTLEQFFSYFKKSGFVISSFRINADMLSRGYEKAGLKIFSLLNRLKPFKKFFSCNLYCILENKG